jgi:RNA polymerase sigma factor (sigma-70 family)
MIRRASPNAVPSHTFTVQKRKMPLDFDHLGILSVAAPASTSWTLLRRLQQTPADGQAWEAFARRYGPAVFQWCRQWGLQEADAEDVTQTVLVKLVEHMKVFVYDPAQSFRGWLKTVAYHAWAKFCGSRQKLAVASVAVYEALGSLEAKESLAERLEREYDQELFELALLRVSQRVENQTWEAFRLLAFEGLSGAEVAKRLQLKVGTAYVARSKVQRMIQEEVAKLEADDGDPGSLSKS